METPSYEQEPEAPATKMGMAEPPAPNSEDQNQTSGQELHELPRGNEGQAKVPEPPKVQDQGREPQVEEHPVPRDAVAKGYQTRSGRVVREPSRYRDFRKF